MELSYQEATHMNRLQARKQMVNTYLQTGSLSHTAQWKLLGFGYTVPEEFMLFPVVLLDTVSASWQLETGQAERNSVLNAPYSSAYRDLSGA
ncbi:MAG: hypothetical protein KatS3mg023_1633 [Armatimonadota bacterium]|nr:MAG: hypothetical protein KatS3mg023_1633 [Armatimonadota bacterium]